MNARVVFITVKYDPIVAVSLYNNRNDINDSGLLSGIIDINVSYRSKLGLVGLVTVTVNAVVAGTLLCGITKDPADIPVHAGRVRVHDYYTGGGMLILVSLVSLTDTETGRVRFMDEHYGEMLPT